VIRNCKEAHYLLFIFFSIKTLKKCLTSDISKETKDGIKDGQQDTKRAKKIRARQRPNQSSSSFGSALLDLEDRIKRRKETLANTLAK
jgi:hypothetical protein